MSHQVGNCYFDSRFDKPSALVGLKKICGIMWHIWMSTQGRKPPKWRVKIMVGTLLKSMIWGSFPIIFGSTPISWKNKNEDVQANLRPCVSRVSKKLQKFRNRRLWSVKLCGLLLPYAYSKSKSYSLSQEVQFDQTLHISRIGNPESIDHPKDQPLCLVLDFQGFHKPIGSMGLVYLPTFTFKINHSCR